MNQPQGSPPTPSALMAQSDSDVNLMSLPADIKIEIVKHLPWKDVLDVRRIKCLAWATREKCTWVNLVNEHIASELVPPRLERPMDNYTASELEHTFLRWKGAELAWKTADKHPRKERQFRCGMPQLTHLVKGGRWYLTTADQTAAVTYYDLDAKTIRGVELIPPQARCCRTVYNNLRVCLEVSTTSSHLEFTMTFSIFDMGDESPRVAGLKYVYQAIHVWRVHCVLDSSGHATGLVATKIATLPHRPSFHSIHSMSLSGSLIGLLAQDSKERELVLLVVDWERAQGQIPYPMRIIGLGNRLIHIHLLPKNRLLCQGYKEILLYDFWAIQEKTEIPRDKTDFAKPVWIVKGMEDRFKLPPALFCVAGTTRMLFTEKNSLYSLFFNDDSHKTPELVQVTTGWRKSWHRFRIALGFQRTLVFDKDTKTFFLITYTPTSQGPLTVKAFSVSRSSSMFLPPIDDFPMDEDTGRIVIHATFCQQAVVIDFSKYI